MKRQHLVIIGAGHAGLWAAISAARTRYQLNKEDQLDITLISKTDYHGIRPRFYETDLTNVTIPLTKLLPPVNVKSIIDSVVAIDPDKQTVTTKKHQSLSYDKLIFAAGSQLNQPNIAGLKEYAFNVDTYEAALALKEHLEKLSNTVNQSGKYNAVVIGGGFTGLEVATELVSRFDHLAKSTNSTEQANIFIVDHNQIGHSLGEKPQPTIQQALNDLNITALANETVKKITANSIEFVSGKTIDTQTVVWTAGMHASPLTKSFNLTTDNLGRLYVDEFLKIKDQKNCFAAGDVAHAMVDATHSSVMSCQHGRPQGRIAGHNAVAELFNEDLIIYSQPVYVTCLDLGEWGAIFTEGWERDVKTQGKAAKDTKMMINRERIYPPLDEQASSLFSAAEPIIQAPPKSENS